MLGWSRGAQSPVEQVSSSPAYVCMSVVLWMHTGQGLGAQLHRYIMRPCCRYLHQHGLLFGPDPSSNPAIGGMASTGVLFDRIQNKHCRQLSSELPSGLICSHIFPKQHC